jgi:hypothetical protein
MKKKAKAKIEKVASGLNDLETPIRQATISQRPCSSCRQARTCRPTRAREFSASPIHSSR